MLPDWIKKIIKAATNYAGSELENWVKANELNLDEPAQGPAEVTDDDLPF